MFNINEYIKNGISIDINLDKEKISKDIDDLKEALLNLENIIGPYKLKVVNGKIKLKTKDDF